MATTSSIEGFTPENVRESVLPRAFLARSLTSRMALRLRRGQQLMERAHGTVGDERIFAWMAAVSLTWTLVENTLKLYETIAEQIDTRFSGKRRGLDARFLRERSGDERIEFHRRVWMFSIFDQVPDAAYERLGVEAQRARSLIDGMIDRSLDYLSVSEDVMRKFYRKYKDVMNAHKHGRALFAFGVAFDPPTDTALGKGSITASTTAVTALVADRGGRGVPRTFVTVTADDELIADVEHVFDRLVAQLPKFAEYFAALTDAALQLLAYLEQAPDARRPVIPFSLFAEPYSAEEATLLATIRAQSLNF